VALAFSFHAYFFGSSAGIQIQVDPEGLISPFEGSTEAPWELFPDGPIPGESPHVQFKEGYVLSDPSSKCNEHHLRAPFFVNVSVPLLVPFLLEKNHPHWQDAVVVVVPGGAFQVLAWDSEGTDVARWLNTLGISAVVLKYRVPLRPWLNNDGIGSLAAVIDAQRAISMVRAKVVPLGFNASRVGYMGFSAGGVMGLSVSSAASRLYPHIDAIDDVSYKPGFQLIIYGSHINGDPMVTNDTAAKQEPPSFFATAVDDPCVAMERTVFDFVRLKEIGVKPIELHVYRDGKHGYSRCSAKYLKKRYSVCSWTEEALLFMSDFLGNGILSSP